MKKSVFSSLLVLVVLAVGTACGAKSSDSEGPNNGGRTHFLTSCDSDAECGALECLSRVCTRPCDTDVDCSDLDEAARCEAEICAAAATNEPAPSESDAGRANDAPSCDDLSAVPALPDPIDIRVTNDRAEYLVLDSPVGCAGNFYVAIESRNPASPGTTPAGACVFSCDQVLTQPLGCDPSCPGATPIVLDPGETVTVPWRPRLGHLVPVPPECCVTDYCPSECTLLSVAEPGPHRATLVVATLGEAEAAACRESSTTSPPLPPPGAEEAATCRVEPDEFERITVDFELESGAVELSISSNESGDDVSEVCEPLLAPPPEGELVDFGVTNLRSEPLALGPPSGCAGTDYVTVESLNDASPGRGLTNSCSDGLTCDRILVENLGCGPVCATTPPLVVDPGERVVVQWRALMERVETVIPECCASESACPAQCLFPRVAEPGPYSATLALAPLTAGEADLCRDDPQHTDCMAKVNNLELERVALEFALGEGQIELGIE